MNENQPNFESLRRLLALKRHETPPPGYFNNFSRQVITRICAGETGAEAGFSGRLFASMPWLLQWVQSLETKPVFAGGFATALCALLLFGAVIAQRPDSVAQAILQPAPQEVAPLVASATPTTMVQPVNPMFIEDNSTNPVSNFASAPIGQMPVSAQFASFPISSGN
ncbi:MAG TPA: hypothetical protein VN784_02220 [Candidatus Limnocylindrales bacterium]|nr:hypothetical protein [Candidatus Limnocylindrales bacterium]